MSESEALYFRVMQDSFRLIQPAANFLYEESKVNISKAQNLKSGQTASKRETETERDTQRDTQREIERDTHTHTRTHTETERQRQRDRESRLCSCLYISYFLSHEVMCFILVKF